jgi:hypothetical protein
MTRDARAPEFARALIVAPLAAPVAVVLGLAVRALVSPRPGTEGINPVVGVVFVVAVLAVYGAPLAYGATFVILWPTAVLLRESGAFSWWSLTLVAMVAGGVLFPLYFHLLDPRATWGFFPGAGAAAGAATGWTFWFVSTSRPRRPGELP